MKRSTLLFSLAVNGYDLLYKENLTSHKEYAEKINADYVSVNRPYMPKLGVESCWMKLLLLERALQKGYEFVIFVDADAHIMSFAPDIREFTQDNKDIYFARGYTGRINSGVILVKRSDKALDFFKQVISSMERPLSKESSVGWGENGHIIQTAKSFDNIGYLHHKWNNTFDNKIPDYIRHFSHGPLRSDNYRIFFHTPMMYFTRLIRKLDHLFYPNKTPELKRQRLNNAFNLVCARYSQFQF